MTAPLAATSSVATTAPFGRRLCEVTENRASGGYRVFSLLDADGPEPLPGQFYMLATDTRWEEQGERPFLPRALSVADATPAASFVFRRGSAGAFVFRRGSAGAFVFTRAERQ